MRNFSKKNNNGNNTFRHLKQNLIILLFIFIIQLIASNEYNNGNSGNSSEINDNAKDFNNNLNRDLTPISSNVSTALWWAEQWTYRVNVNITTQVGINYTNLLIEKAINFTDILVGINVFGNFDNKSVRIIEWNDTTLTNREVPSQFDQETNYNSLTNAKGTCCWVMDGETKVLPGQQKTRYYFIYFDIIENGLKSIPDYSSISNLTLTTNTAGKDYTIENDKIRISLAEGSPPNGGSYYDHIYEVYDKRTGKDQQQSSYHWGWALYSWTYGGYSSTNFNGITDVQVDSYGSIRIIVKMIFEHANFKFEIIYTLNYLDDSIQIQYKVTAKTTITQGDWYLASRWSPGYGTTYSAPNSAYGLGGYDFDANYKYDANHNFDGSNNFCSHEYLDPDHFDHYSSVQIITIRPQSWFADWDESKNQGIGTIWNAETNNDTSHTYLSEYGYQTSSYDEGRMIYLHFKPKSLGIGESFNLSVWGIVFNNDNGVYIKSRAKGLQNSPVIVIGNAVDSSKTITIKLYDLELNPINNATVQLENQTHGNIKFQDSNSIGNVTFRGLYNNLWYITVFYQIGFTNYTIKNANLTINTPFSANFYLNLQCNLTTIHILVTDNKITNPSYWAVSNANVTLQDFTNNQNLSSYYSDINGQANIRIPTTFWKFNVQYQGISRLFIINNVGSSAFIQNYSVISECSINMNISISESSGQIYIKDVFFVQSSWPHQNFTTNYPYTLDLYIGSNLTIDYYYQDINTGFGISGATGNSWTLFQNGDIINSSQISGINIPQMEINGNFGGNYNLTLKTLDYQPGTYSLSLNLTKSGYLFSVCSLMIQILNFTTSLECISPIENRNIYWNTTLMLQLNYTSVNPEVQNITIADLNFFIQGTNISGSLTQMQPTWGLYFLNMSLNLSANYYTINIYANRTNFAYASLSINIQILKIPTNLNIEIPLEYRENSNLLKVALGENITFWINYTDFFGNPVNLCDILNVFLDEETALPTYFDGNNLFLCTINTTTLENCIGIHVIKINAQMDNYETQEIEFAVKIMEYWAAKLTIVEPPTFYKWGNNASFIIKYECTEIPRNGWNLSNALLSSLSIILRNNSIDYTQYIFNADNFNREWGVSELASDALYGPGQYRVWFNTGLIHISKQNVYYAIPSINSTFYQPISERIYLWINPVENSLTHYISGHETPSVDQFNLYLAQTAKISVKLNVTDKDSIFYGQNLDGAQISYHIFNGSDLIEQNLFENIGNGLYETNINANKLGTFTIELSSQLENYTSNLIRIKYICEKKPIKWNPGLNIEDGIISSPQNRELKFSIQALDVVEYTTLSEALMVITLNGINYTFTEDPTQKGNYIAYFPVEILQSLTAEKSYILIFYVIKENYITLEFTLVVNIGLPVDPILSVPYRTWTIIGISLSVLFSLYGITRIVQNSQVPIMIKNINKTKKQITKQKTFEKERIISTQFEKVAELLEKEATPFNMDLAPYFQRLKTMDSSLMDSVSTPSDILNKK